MEYARLAKRWTTLMAPKTSDIRTELVRDAADFLGISVSESWDRLQGADKRFRDEWERAGFRSVGRTSIARFYNQTDTRVVRAHQLARLGSDPSPYAVVARSRAHPNRPRVSGLRVGHRQRRGRLCRCRVRRDAGGRIRSSARVCRIACRPAGCAWKRSTSNASPFRRVASMSCLRLDVLEHIPEPLPVVRSINRAMRDGALLGGARTVRRGDPEHPMHVVHRDIVHPTHAIARTQAGRLSLPGRSARATHLPEGRARNRASRLISVYDGYLNNRWGNRIASCYRAVVPPRPLSNGASRVLRAPRARRASRAEAARRVRRSVAPHSRRPGCAGGSPAVGLARRSGRRRVARAGQPAAAARRCVSRRSQIPAHRSSTS